MVLILCFTAAAVICGFPLQGGAEDAANKPAAAEKDLKEDSQREDGQARNVRDGVNRAYDKFKTEAEKGKKNLNELYEREKERSRR